MLPPLIGAADLPRRTGRRSGVVATLLALLLYAAVLFAAVALVRVAGSEIARHWRPSGSSAGPGAD